MIKDICTDKALLAIKSKECFFTELEVLKNKQIIQDLLDTANAWEDDCVGLAANQIGEYKRIFVMLINDEFVPMVNPIIMPVRSAGIKKFKEGCLSHPDRLHRLKIRRYKQINVKYQLVTGLEKTVKLIANNIKIESVIAQHGMDHLNGKLI